MNIRGRLKPVANLLLCSAQPIHCNTTHIVCFIWCVVTGSTTTAAPVAVAHNILESTRPLGNSVTSYIFSLAAYMNYR